MHLRRQATPGAAQRVIGRRPDRRVHLSLGISPSADGTVRLWNPATGGLRGELTGHRGPVLGVAFSPDGALLATAGADGTVRLWNPATGGLRGELTGHTGAVNAVAFGSYAFALASASTDGTVRLWDTPGELLSELTGHTGPVTAVAVSPDGNLLASAGTDQTVQLWDLSWWHSPAAYGTADWAEAGCRVVNRNLSQAEWDQFAGGLPYQRTCPTLPAGEGTLHDTPVAQYIP